MTDNGVVVLQNCVDLPKLVPDSCSETSQTSFCDGNEAMVVKVEDGTDIVVQEEKDPLLIHEVSCEGVIASTAPFPPSKKLAIATRSFHNQQAEFLYFILPLCSLSI
jgi:hypothetical protein